eukprot:3720094-Pleurochrysis_carterae.AAC.1
MFRSLARVAVERARRSALPRSSVRSGAVDDDAAAAFADAAPNEKDARGALLEACATPASAFSLNPTPRESSISHMVDHATAGQPPICKLSGAGATSCIMPTVIESE